MLNDRPDGIALAGNEPGRSAVSHSRIDAAEDIRTWLVSKLAEALSVEPEVIHTDEPLTNYGLGSIQAVTLVADLEEWIGTELPVTLLWDYPTIDEIAAALIAHRNGSPLLTS